MRQCADKFNCALIIINSSKFQYKMQTSFIIDNSFTKGAFLKTNKKTIEKSVKSLHLESVTIYLGRD